MKTKFALLALVASIAHAELPLNPGVTQENIQQTICVVGWTKTIRPPVSYTNSVKRKLMVAAGIPWSQARLYELDHRTSLDLGGAPHSLDNLQLQLWDGLTGAKVKDKLEVRLNRMVCSGELPLVEAQQCIYDDWQACFEKYLPKEPSK